MTGVRRYRAHGYAVESDVALPLDPADGAGAGAGPGEQALRLRLGQRTPVPHDAPPGRLLAHLTDDEKRTYYSFARDDDGTLRLRYHGAVELVADAALSDVRADVDPAADPGLVAVLGAGAMLAVRLVLDGHLVLHASAVELDGTAVAFCGASGMGKSTLSALAVLSGWRLLADDVLRVDLGPAGAEVWPGSSALRLRESASEVAAAFGSRTQPTADGRTAVADGPGPRPHAPVPLAAVVVPRVVRGLAEPAVRRLPPFEALRLLLRFPRVVGWCDPTTTAEQLDRLAAACRQVPVVVADVPWGPPFDPRDVGTTLALVLRTAGQPLTS